LNESRHNDWIVAYYFGIVAEGLGSAVGSAVDYQRAIRWEHWLMHFWICQEIEEGESNAWE
jgi:hypothetical protein